jgi:DNA-binding response OmpR family regulator
MKKLLIQDTDQGILEILTLVLREEGYNVMTTIHYKDILNDIKLFKPHVVMLDFKLNGDECIAAYKLIRDKYPHLPVLALSCNRNIHQEYSNIGFDDYISKPFDLDKLYSILRKHIPKMDTNSLLNSINK